MGLLPSASRELKRIQFIASGGRRLGFRDHHQRRANNPVKKAITFLQHGNHGVGRRGVIDRLDLADGLMLVWIELLTYRIDFQQIRFFKRVSLDATFVTGSSLFVDINHSDETK